MRLASAEEDARRRVDAHRRALDEARARRAEEDRRALEAEIAQVHAAAAREVEARAARRAAFLQERRLRADERMAEAVATLTRILRDGPGGPA